MPVYHRLKLLILTLSRMSNKSTRMIWMSHAKKEHAISLMLKKIWWMRKRGLELLLKLQKTIPTSSSTRTKKSRLRQHS